jgi:hypothetical protein
VTIIYSGRFLTGYAMSTTASAGSFNSSDASPVGLSQSSWLATGLTLPSLTTTVQTFTAERGRSVCWLKNQRLAESRGNQFGAEFLACYRPDPP